MLVQLINQQSFEERHLEFKLGHDSYMVDFLFLLLDLFLLLLLIIFNWLKLLRQLCLLLGHLNFIKSGLDLSGPIFHISIIFQGNTALTESILQQYCVIERNLWGILNHSGSFEVEVRCRHHLLGILVKIEVGVRQDAEIVLPLVQWIETLLYLANLFSLVKQLLFRLDLFLLAGLFNVFNGASIEDITEVNQFVEKGVTQVDLNVRRSTFNLNFWFLLILVPLVSCHHQQPAPFLLLYCNIKLHRAVFDDRKHNVILFFNLCCSKFS